MTFYDKPKVVDDAAPSAFENYAGPKTTSPMKKETQNAKLEKETQNAKLEKTLQPWIAPLKKRQKLRQTNRLLRSKPVQQLLKNNWADLSKKVPTDTNRSSMISVRVPIFAHTWWISHRSSCNFSRGKNTAEVRMLWTFGRFGEIFRLY